MQIWELFFLYTETENELQWLGLWPYSCFCVTVRTLIASTHPFVYNYIYMHDSWVVSRFLKCYCFNSVLSFSQHLLRAYQSSERHNPVTGELWSPVLCGKSASFSITKHLTVLDSGWTSARQNHSNPTNQLGHTHALPHCRAFMESNYQEIKDLNPNFNFLVRPHPEVPSTIVAQYGLFVFFCHLLSWLYIVAKSSGVRWFDMGVLASNIGVGSRSISMAATSVCKSEYCRVKL